MSVTETYEPVLLETDWSETDFDFDFSVFDDTDVVVALVDPDTLVATAQTLGVDYTVTLNTSTVGGTVVFGTAPADGQLVSIRRDIPTTQGTDIPSGGLFRESQIENALDKAILLIQQLEEQIGRALLQNPYQTTSEIVIPVPEAGTVLGWNDDEDALENKTLVDLAAVALASQAQAEAGTDNDTYMTPLRVVQASKGYTLTFDNADLSMGVLTVTHNRGNAFPSVTVFDNNGKIILPDEVDSSSINALTVSLVSYGTITGDWTVVVK